MAVAPDVAYALPPEQHVPNAQFTVVPALAFINGIEPNSTVYVVLEAFVKPEGVTLKIC
jgi:hypothetical protein